MAGAPPGFNDLLQRKYANQESATDSENALRAAQAQQMTGSLASENALRNAQAFQTSETAKTVAPTSQANLASTYAQIPGFGARTNLENAQAGYYGAEADATRFNTTDPASDAEKAAYWSGRNTLGNYGIGSGTVQGVVTPTTTQNERSVTDPYVIPGQKPSPGYNKFQFFSGGTDDVQPLEYDPMNAYSGGTAKVPPPAQAPSGVTPPQATMGAAPPIGGAMDFHTVMAHAMHALASSHPSAANPMHAAGGMTTVPTPAPPMPAPPGPGQTQTSGDWGGQNQGLRAQMGYGRPTKPVQAAGGKTKVPGKGPGNVDSVPSVLAPGEAVLNAGAASHMGRGAIAALNALGAAKMAASGAPPMSPTGQPMASPGPAMGAPPPPPGGSKMPPKGSTPGGAPKPSAPPMTSSKGKPNPKSAPSKPAPKAAAAGKR